MTTDERRSPARARTIKVKLGEQAYQHYRKTGEYDDRALYGSKEPEHVPDAAFTVSFDGKAVADVIAAGYGTARDLVAQRLGHRNFNLSVGSQPDLPTIVT